MLQLQGVEQYFSVSSTCMGTKAWFDFPCVLLSRQQKPDGGHPGGASYRPGGRPDHLHQEKEAPRTAFHQ